MHIKVDLKITLLYYHKMTRLFKYVNTKIAEMHIKFSNKFQ